MEIKPISKKKKIVSVYVSFYYRLFKVIGWILSFVLILMVLLGLVIIISDKSSISNFSIYVVESESMSPTLKKSDAVIVQRQDNYAANDIITFYPSKGADKTYTHRIVNVENTNGSVKFVTKGDNNSVNDPFKTPLELVEGKVTKTLEGIGEIVLFTRSVVGIIVFIIIPATMFLTLNIQSIYNWLKKSYHDNNVY